MAQWVIKNTEEIIKTGSEGGLKVIFSLSLEGCVGVRQAKQCVLGNKLAHSPELHYIFSV